ncbi:MAG: gliding motility-associated C-terminal domain-containing protein [Prevotellaceae bacterium]|nr:gliding motility-associated C-terminal domain-containing protein [Prevotellaceae bacterium]
MKITITNLDFKNDSCTNTVSFSNLSTVNIGSLSYVWDFGDGTTSTDVDPVHVYPSAGEYEVTLTSTSDLVGCVTSITKKINVILDLNIQNMSVCEGSATILTASSTVADAVFSWYRDSGYTDLIQQSNSLQTDKLFADTDFYIEVSKDECKMRDTVHIMVLPLPDLHVNDTVVCYNETVYPKALSSDAILFRWYKNPDYTDLITQEASFTASGLKSDTVFYIEVLGLNGCISRDSVQVTVHPLPDLTVADTAVCYNESIVAAASADGAVITWYSDAAYLNPIVSAASFQTGSLWTDTTFYVKAVSVYSCISTGTEHVEIYPLPNVTLDEITVCHDSTAFISVSSTDAVSLIWYRDANHTDTIIKAFSFETGKLKSDTVFYLEALSINDCSSLFSLNVTVLPLPDLNVKDTAVCYGETVSVTALSSDAASIGWYRNPDYTGLIVQAASFTTPGLKSDTVFYAEAISINGCISRDTLRITVNPLPDLAVMDTVICAYNATVFTAYSKDAATISWYDDMAYSNNIIQASSYETVLTADTVFYIEALSSEGCSTRDAMSISVIQNPSVAAMEDQYLCYGEEITLRLFESDGTVSWNVDPLTVRPLVSQEYVVVASRPPCPDVSDTVRVTVGDSLYIFPSELPDYSSHADYNQQINSNAQSPVYTIISGSLPFGLNLYNSGNLSGTPDGDDQVSVFTVQVEDSAACTAIREYVLEKEFFMPKLFTPNGDGINDVFMRGHEIVIFDRLGVEIFRGEDGWDGTYKNKPAPHDIYFYILTRRLENGQKKMYSGYIGI